jgi:hypothetical protein
MTLRPASTGRFAPMRARATKIQRQPFAPLSLERDDFASNHHPALSFLLEQTFPEKPVSIFPRLALGSVQRPGRQRSALARAPESRISDLRTY